MRRSEWIWVAALVLLFGLGYGYIPARSDRNVEDSFSNEAPGKRVFYLLLESLQPEVHRQSDTLIPADPNADTLVMLGPARYPNRAQWQSLKSWVEEGRSLIFAARRDDPSVRLEAFNIEIVPDEEEFDFLAESADGDESDSETETNPGDGSEQAVSEEDSELADNDRAESGIETILVDNAVNWSSGASIEYEEGAAVVQLSDSGVPQVITQQVGNGIVVIVASDYVFSNRAMVDEVNGLLAYRIFELAIPLGPIYVDEGLNMAGAPKVVGILFEEPFRGISLQLLAIVVLFTWMSSRRLGRPRVDFHHPRRSLVEHAEALGSLHYRAGTGGSLLHTYLDFFRQELGVSNPLDSTQEDRMPSDLSESDRKLLFQATRASKNPRLEPKRFAAIIARLARLRVRRMARKEQ